MFQFAIIDSLGVEPAFLCCGLGFNKNMSQVMRKPVFAICKQPQISLRISAVW